MVEKSVAQRALERAQRGLHAWRRGAVGWSGDGGWVVAGERGALYRVNLQDETCTCRDSTMRETCCKHVYAALVVRAKTGVCSGCGQRFPHRELVELGEDDHDNLTHFTGDHLCAECCDSAGVER